MVSLDTLAKQMFDLKVMSPSGALTWLVVSSGGLAVSASAFPDSLEANHLVLLCCNTTGIIGWASIAYAAWNRVMDCVQR